MSTKSLKRWWKKQGERRMELVIAVEAAGIDMECMFPEATWAEIIGEAHAELQVDIEGTWG